MISAVTGNRDGAGDPAFDITADRAGARLMTSAPASTTASARRWRAPSWRRRWPFWRPRMPGLRTTAEPELGTVQGIYGVDALHLAWG
jgi:hypothetical protein